MGYALSCAAIYNAVSLKTRSAALDPTIRVIRALQCISIPVLEILVVSSQENDRKSDPQCIYKLLLTQKCIYKLLLQYDH